MSETIKTWQKVEGMELPELFNCSLVRDGNGFGHILGGAMAWTSEKHNHFIFDLESKQFTKKAAIPFNNYQGCRGVSIGNKIYIGGGASNYTVTNKFFSYDIDQDTWTTLADIPAAASFYSFGVVGDSIYVCGGVRVDAFHFYNAYNSLFRYDVNTNTWEKKANMLVAAAGAANMPYYGGALYFFGGGAPNKQDKFDNFDSCQKYVVAEDKWYTFSAPPKTSLFPGITTCKDRVYLVGGCYTAPSASSYSYLKNMYEYSFSKDSWTELEDFPIPICIGNLIVRKNHLYHIGGGGLSGEERKCDIYSYELEPSAKLKIVLEKGKTVQLKGLMLPSGVTVEEVDWSSADDTIATVEETGLVTAVELGEVRITVEAKDKSWSDSVLVKVVENPEDIEYRLSILLTEGESCQLTIDNTSDKKETWVSSEPTVATVSQDGKITAASEGIALITVSIEGQDYTEDIYVKVEKAP